jgi:hypothetical protein
MAQGTTSTPTMAPQQAATPGIGMQGAPPKTDPLPPAEPVLFDDIDPVLLVRLYPAARDSADARAQALEAGHRVREEGLALIASQQEPVLTGEAALTGPAVVAAPPLEPPPWAPQANPGQRQQP